MTKAEPRPGRSEPGGVAAGNGQVAGPTVPVPPARFGAVVDRVVPAHLACRIGARARAGERDASLAAGSAVGGIVYDAAGPGGTPVLAGVVAALGALILLGRAGAAIDAAPAGLADLADLAEERGRDAPAPAARRNRSSSKQRDDHAEVTVRGHTEAAAKKERNCYG
jgi:hypothetical protein